MDFEAELKTFQKLPAPSLCRLIDFKEAEVVPGIVNDTFILIVAGVKPWITMSVELHPLIYITQPDFWGIEVVGCQKGIGLPQTGTYQVSLDISHFRGKKGIEVIGANLKRQLSVP